MHRWAPTYGSPHAQAWPSMASTSRAGWWTPATAARSRRSRTAPARGRQLILERIMTDFDSA
eukprot:850877-Pyramimonas_sp.AAC.1